MITKEMIKQAQMQQAKTKHNSALLLSIMSMILLTYSLVMMCRTSDMDYVIVFNVASLAAGFGVMNLKK
jgi:uncharacterized membrane protein